MQAGATWWLWNWLGKASPPKSNAATMALALYALLR